MGEKYSQGWMEEMKGRHYPDWVLLTAKTLQGEGVVEKPEECFVSLSPNIALHPHLAKIAAHESVTS